MTVREIQFHRLELYGLEVSPDLQTITDAVLETVAEWQYRPLEAMCPLVFFDALRVSMDFVSWNERKAIAAELKKIYRAKDADAGAEALDEFDASLPGKKYPAIAQSWRCNWEHVIAFFPFPEGVRRIIYTTNAIEALNAKLRRAVRTKGRFPTDEAAIKVLYLDLRQVASEWKMPPREWCEAETQFAIMFDERFLKA
jgi:putative transposase